MVRSARGQVLPGRSAASEYRGEHRLDGEVELEKDRLIYASVPTLVTESTIEEYYLDGDSATYIRLDLNYETLGEPFSHPLAHIHVGDEDSPRFALDGGTSGNVVMDFLEFIYRNHAPEKWLQWARRQWLSKGADSQPRMIRQC